MVAELPEPVRKIHAPKIEDNSSLHKVVEDVVSFLDDKQIRIIGIWGRVGTGKTTIIQNLNNHKDIAKMFDIVIWAPVSKEWSLKKLQGAIMQRLKLNVESTAGIEENAWRISEELKGKKCLILVDEIFDLIDLHKVMGIQGNLESKVVLASRLRDICKDMEADELINVKPLSDHEAFNMFKKKVGRSIHFPGIKPVAELVVRECGGLPLLIDKVARTFRKKERNVSLWRDALNNLRRWENTQGMDEVLEFLRFDYDNLDSDAKKVCFLYGALYPEEYDIYIDYLLECWRAEGFIPVDESIHDKNAFRDARDKGHAILDDLINVSLLESSEKRKCVKMNKVLRDMALKISSQIGDSKFLAKPCEGLEEPPNHEEWKQASRISLMNNELCNLPEALECRDLLTLLLQRNKNLCAIPKFFFKSMCNLRVLDLHDTSIESLPSSLSALISLKGLYLNSCSNLVELPSQIKELVQLEVLDIRGTKISLVQVRCLIWLKCLRISLSNFGIGSHNQNQLGNVSRFVSLEEFSVVIDSSKQSWDKIVETIATEVASLEKLTSLQFCFPKVDCLEIFVTTSPAWKKGSCLTFQFAVGDHDSTCFQILKSFDYPSYNRLTLVNSEGVNPVISKVLMETHAFTLINHKGASRLSDFGTENMENMLVCLIERCDEMETIINGDVITKGVLECLEELRINNVLKLESIWEGPVHPGSLTQLTTLTLTKCPELKKIFSNGVIQQLLELQHLRIEECHQIEEIIMQSENIELESSSLPRLKTLVLLDLPRLRSIWVNDSLKWPSL